MARSNVGGVKIYWILWSFFGEFVIGSGILKLYYKSFLDLVKQTLISTLRLFRIIYEFNRSFGEKFILNFRFSNLFTIRISLSAVYEFSIKFWKDIARALKYLNILSIRIPFGKITQLILNDSRIFGLRLFNFYKQLSSSENSAK
jgi:glycerol uptake facilitator-like aquaporin